MDEISLTSIDDGSVRVCDCNTAFYGSPDFHQLLYHRVKNLVYRCPICGSESVTGTGLQNHCMLEHDIEILNVDSYQTHVSPSYVSLLTCPSFGFRDLPSLTYNATFINNVRLLTSTRSHHPASVLST